MHKLQTAWMTLHQVDTRNTAVVDLLEELLHISPALMPDPCLGEEAAACPALIYTYAEVNVLAESHLRESAQRFPQISLHTHIEAARIEFSVQLLFAATDASGRKETSHAVADCLLHIRKALMGSIRTAESITRIIRQFGIHRRQIPRRQHAVAVQDNQVFPLATLRTIVAALPGSAVLLGIITQGKPGSMPVNNFLTWYGRTILHNHDLKVVKRLYLQTCQQFVYLVRTVVDRNYNGIFHQAFTRPR